MLLVFADAVSPRFEHIVNFFSNELFDDRIQITTDKNEYHRSELPKLNYSSEDICDNEFLITPVSLLFETGVRAQETACFEINFHKAFFQSRGDMHFDIFAASFYLLSRYEEYLPFEKDHYGRYPHTNSLAFNEGFLQQPLVNTWIKELRSALLRKFPDLRFKRAQFANMITYDIDMAYSYLHKGLARTMGAVVTSLIKGQWLSVLERCKVLLGLKKDPFDCYEWLDALHLYCRLKPWYFFLVAKKRSVYDKNTSTSAKAFRALVEYYSGAYDVGLHPSWQSGDSPELLREELEWLTVIADRKMTSSRQHYIRFTLPGTYRQLIDVGIQKEFSMGYATVNGFRASVCSPFYWYDLEREISTGLLVYPFCFMDANSFYQQKHSPGQAYAELLKYYETVKKANGMLVTIWHNSILGTDPGTREWRSMFELFMKETVYWDAYYDGA